jgi:hypothetical protein
MPGFGSWPFGIGPFGEYHWSKHVLWNDLPEIDRKLDAEEAEDRLQTFVNSIKPSFDGLLWTARDFGSLRDPNLVRTQYQGVINLNLLFSIPTESGRTIRALFEKTDSADPFNPLEDTSIGWILEDQAGREYTVNSVHKLWDEGPMLELVGAAELPVSAFSEGTALTGVVQFEAGSTAVTGLGTLFLTDPDLSKRVSPGQYVSPSTGRSIGLVESVIDDEHLTLAKIWYGRTISGPAVVADAADGAVTLRPPSLIGFLGADFGIEVDLHEPESFQRSSVRDAHQWMDRKGAQKSYDIIGKISGFRVVAYPLWRVGFSTSLLTGTLTFTEDSAVVTGSGTAFLSEVTVGQYIAPDGRFGYLGKVQTVVDDTTIILVNPWESRDAVDVAGAIVTPVIPSWLPLGSVFEIPPEGGKFYTTTDPRLPRFDDIAADVIPLDYACIEEPNWTSDAITPPTPPPPDGTSVEEAIGIVMQDLPVLGAPVDLGAGRWRLQVGPAVDLWPIAAVGQWYASWGAMPGEKFYLETKPVEVAPGVWEFEVQAGESPVFSSTLSIDYECPLIITCDFCRASLLRIEMVPAEVLTEPGASLDDSLGRMARKIQQVVPVHVRVADIAQVTGPVQVSLNPTVQVSATVVPP